MNLPSKIVQMGHRIVQLEKLITHQADGTPIDGFRASMIYSTIGIGFIGLSLLLQDLLFGP